jgi:hypothetical protein
MKKTCLIVLLCSLVLFVGITAAGCVRNAGNSPGQPAGTATPSVPGTEQPETPAPIQQPGFQTGSYSVQDQNSTLGNGQGVQLDLASAASKLGTTAQQLSDALEVGNTTQGVSGNLTQATEQLEATAQQLSAALGVGNETPGLYGNLTEAAQQLGVTEQQLRTALGIPSVRQTAAPPARQQS